MNPFKIISFVLIGYLVMGGCFNRNPKKNVLREHNSSIFQARKIQQQSELQISFISDSKSGFYRMQVKPILFVPVSPELQFKITIKTNPRYQHQGSDEQLWTPHSNQEALEWIVNEKVNFNPQQDKFYYPIEISLIPLSQDSHYLSLKTQTATHLPDLSKTEDSQFKIKSQSDKTKNLKLFY